MSHENVEIVRATMAIADEARNADPGAPSDDLFQRLAALVAPGAQIDMSRRVLNPDVYTGEAGLRQLLAEVREVWSEFWVTPERFIDTDDRVVVIEAIRGRGRGSGVQLERQTASIWTLRDARIIRVQIGFEPDQALQAVGLAE